MSKRLSKNAVKFHGKRWTVGAVGTKSGGMRTRKKKGKTVTIKSRRAKTSRFIEKTLRNVSSRKLFIKTLYRFRLTQNGIELKRALYKEFLKLPYERQKLISTYKYDRSKNPIQILKELFES